MNFNKSSISHKNITTSTDERRPTINNKIHDKKSHGFSTLEDLNPIKTSSNKMSFNFCNLSYLHVNTEKKSNKNFNIQFQTIPKNKTIEINSTFNFKRKKNNKIFGDVTKICSKVYKSKNNTFFKSIFHEEPKEKLRNKTKINENVTQNKSEKINNDQKKRITFNYGDYAKNEIKCKHPKIYILRSVNKKNNARINLPKITKSLLTISRKTNLMELIPDYMNTYEKYNKDKFYEYYIKKKFELKKFN